MCLLCPWNLAWPAWSQARPGSKDRALWAPENVHNNALQCFMPRLKPESHSSKSSSSSSSSQSSSHSKSHSSASKHHHHSSGSTTTSNTRHSSSKSRDEKTRWVWSYHTILDHLVHFTHFVAIFACIATSVQAIATSIQAIAVKYRIDCQIQNPVSGSKQIQS